jgi:hypothetical protein
MPLQRVLNGAKQCTALTKQPCQNPAAYGCKTYRLHGARKNIVSGKDHVNFLHGQRLLETQEESSRKLCELRYLESLGHAIGMMSGHKIRGRKLR